MKFEAIFFHDHCKDGDCPTLAVVFGLIFKEKKDYLVVKWWHSFNNDGDDKHNYETIVVLKSAILKRVKVALTDKQQEWLQKMKKQSQ